MDLLTMDGVSAHYGRVRALWGVSLSVGRGETVSVLGANGAGKSTALKAVMGLVRVTSGSIRLRGDEIVGAPPHRVVSKGVAFVPEGRRLFPAMSVEENLAVGAPRGCRDLDERAGAVFSLFPALRERRAVHAGRLSGGEQQMVAIGRALMAGPELLVVDEPSLGLSPAATERTVEALNGLSGAGVSVLLAEQSPELALGASDRTYVFENGRVALSGPSREVAADPRVREAYMGIGAR